MLISARMAYPHKINWSDPARESDVVSFTMEPVKTAVLHFHVQIEGELEDIINLHFRDPAAFKINGFARKVALVRALIGKTPDDEIWSIVNKLNEFRNKFAHGTPGPETLQKYADEILEQIRKIWPAFSLTPDIDQGKHLQILAHALFAVRRFFREIREWLTSQPAKLPASSG
jgi:hypothetical protein